MNHGLPGWCLAATLACACGSSPAVDGGPPITAQSYYALNAGQCFEYCETDGGAPDQGLRILSNPTGVELHFIRHGQDQRIDYLVFDGGLALLTQQQTISGVSQPSRVFSPPLSYLEAPLSTASPSLVSSGSYQESGPTGSGQASWEVDVLNGPQPWTAAGGSYADVYQLSVTVTDSQVADGGPTVLEQVWAAPNTGLVELYLPGDTGSFVNYLLQDVIQDAGAATPCAAN
jgi:hypothetical protein